jgi:hypothetical protein
MSAVIVEFFKQNALKKPNQSFYKTQNLKKIKIVNQFEKSKKSK